MNNVLRQATASQSRSIGPFVDDTDFKTPETALTIANTDVKLIPNGAASANKNSGGGTHRANGHYGFTFDATDTATVGELEATILVAGALEVTKTFFVVEEAVYDALFAASATGPQVVASIVTGAINAAAIADGAIDLATFAADVLPLFGIAAMGTAQAGAASSIQLASATNFVSDNVPNQFGVFIYAGTGLGQARPIDSYVNSTDTATVTPVWVINPDNTSKYIVFAIPQMSTSSVPAVNLTQINGVAVTSSGGRMEVNATHCNGTAIPSAAGRAEVNTTHAAGTAWGSGAITAAAIASGAITNAKFAANAIDATAIAANAFAAAKFASGAFDAVWTVAARVLTAGTNIVLAKGTGVTGFTDLDAPGVRGALGMGSANLDSQLAALFPASSYTAPLSAAGTRAALGMSSANLDSQLGTLAGYIDTEIGTIITAIAALPTANGVRDAVFAKAFAAAYGGYSFEQIMGIIVAAAAGKSSGLPLAPKFRNLIDSGFVIQAVSDGIGNRTSVTLTP